MKLELIKVNDKVRVLEDKDKDGRWRQCHTGVVVALTSSFAKVYKPRTRQDDFFSGDVESNTAEWFPIHSNYFRTVRF